MKPNFLCIGAPKAGTTWLHLNLSQHPKIWLPPIKEIHYFDEIYLDEKWIKKRRLKTLRDVVIRQQKLSNANSEKLQFLSKFALTEDIDDNWYLSLFEEADEDLVVGEITPAYSALPEAGVAHISRLLGNDTKIIYMLRNPIKRACSNFIMNKRKQIGFNYIISEEEWMSFIDNQNALTRTNYIATIELYEKYFSKENILYGFYDEICLNSSRLLRKICQFLNLEYKSELFQESVSRQVNKNPKIDVPQKIKDLLYEKYQEQEDFIIRKFNPSSFSF